MIYGARGRRAGAALLICVTDPYFQDDGTTRGYTSNNEQVRFIEGAFLFSSCSLPTEQTRKQPVSQPYFVKWIGWNTARENIFKAGTFNSSPHHE
jgi:hypothetical protein